LDKFGRYYGWFLIVATGLPAVMRLIQPREMAEITAERVKDEKKRSRWKLYGWLTIVGSFVLIPIYFIWSHKVVWLVGFALGVLTGIEMIGNAASPQTDSLARQNRVYGAIYAVATVAAYFIMFHSKLQ